jgi:hypothetical protein
MVMQRLAILDEEKRSADKRIEEEYMRRLDNEDTYYLEKRTVLLEAITDTQEGVMVVVVAAQNRRRMMRM